MAQATSTPPINHTWDSLGQKLMASAAICVQLIAPAPTTLLPAQVWSSSEPCCCLSALFCISDSMYPSAGVALASARAVGLSLSGMLLQMHLHQVTVI